MPAGRQVRHEWEHCLDYLRDGEDTLIVAAADRVARSALQLAETLTQLHSMGIGFRSLGEPTLDTRHHHRRWAGTPRPPRRRGHPRPGRPAEDTRLGLGGRPSVITPELLERARELRAAGATYTAIATDLGVGKTTIRRVLPLLK